MSQKTIIIIAIIVALLSGAIIFLNLNKKSPSNEESINEYQSVSDSIRQTYTLTPSKENSANNIYADSYYGFSFEYPRDFTATKFKEGEDGDTILVQYQGVSNSINEYPKNSGFQIFIFWFDEPGPLTKERILQDLPDLTIKNAESRVLKNGIPALLFFSEEPSLGETREIWFIKDGYLYQITATKEIDSLVAQIIGTWMFQ